MRLTDVDKLSEHKFTRESAKSSDYMRGWNDAIDTIIDNAPTVDTTFKEVVASECGQKSVERPKGEWIIVKDEKWGDNVKCPFCGKEIAGTDLNFCCKCGAKLIGSEKMNGDRE